jgi:hypothetical protein
MCAVWELSVPEGEFNSRGRAFRDAHGKMTEDF